MTFFKTLRAKMLLFAVGLFRRMTLGVRCVLIDGEKILLVRHTYMPGWHFPGGGIEPGESAADSAAREVVEETGYKLTTAPELAGIFLNSAVSDRDHVLLFVCRGFELSHVFKPGAEIAELRWFAKTNLPDNVNTGTRRRLKEMFDDQPRDAQW